MYLCSWHFKLKALNPDPSDMDDEDDNLYEDAEDDIEEGEYVIHERGGGDAGK